MTFSFDSSFRHCLKRYHPTEVIDIKRKLDAFIRSYAHGKVPGGFGLKKIKKNLWEIRINLPQRILLLKFPGETIFTFIGDHDEIRQFIKHF